MAGLLSAAAPDPEALTRDARQTLATPLGRELWKYTPTQTFVDAIAAAAPRPGVILRGGGQPGVTVHPIDEAHGVAWLAETVARQRQPERYPLTDMAWSRARGGWLIRVAGRTEVPIEVDYDEAGVAPLVLRVEPGASLTLIERTAAEGFLAQPTLIAIEAGARLDHQRHALTSEHGHYASLNVRLADRAHYRLNHNLIGGRRRRAEVHVRIDGREAEVELSGAYVVEAGTHLDQQVVVEHCSPGSVSRQKFHGIGAGKGRSVFNGRIHIHPGRERQRRHAVEPEPGHAPRRRDEHQARARDLHRRRALRPRRHRRSARRRQPVLPDQPRHSGDRGAAAAQSRLPAGMSVGQRTRCRRRAAAGGADMSIDVRSADFPMFARRAGERTPVYLDSAATTQKPRAVIQALVDYYERDNANVHRAAHALAERATRAFEDSREKVRAFINAATPRRSSSPAAPPSPSTWWRQPSTAASARATRS
jgi:hypothetical protein